jgi:hypothetical protein
MPRAEASADSEALLSRLAEPNPEWAPLLELLRETLALRDEAVERVRLERDLPPDSPAEAPLLHHATLRLPEAWLAGALLRLCSAAGVTPLENRDRPLLEQALLGEVEGDPRQAIIVHHAAMPLLAQGAAALPMEAAESWQQGYCPVCAAWPLLAELRGMEQARRLRCGRCGTDWRGELLHCVFCGERNHASLGSLRQDAVLERATVDTCASCGGYLKAIRTLTPLSFAELWLTDLETVELDLAARQRGYARPAGLGFPLEVQLAIT